jgi:MFS family permease
MDNKNVTHPRLVALRHRDFRLLWFGQLLSSIGSQMQIIAVNWHVYVLLQNHSSTLSFWQWHFLLNEQALGVGALGAVRVVPIFLFALLGGALADQGNRRGLIIYAQVAAIISTFLLTYVTLSGRVTIGWLYLFTAFDVAISAFNEPAQNAFFPELVPNEHLANATTLYSLLWQVGTIAGPPLAASLIALTGQMGLVYLLNGCSFIAVLLTVLFIQSRETHTRAEETLSWQVVRGGWHFVRSSRMVWCTMVLDFYATFFSTARTMLPFVANSILHAGVQGYGILSIAQPVGGLLTGLVLAIKKHLHRQGAILLLSVAAYGVATAFFGITPYFVLSFILFALTGVGDTISTVIRGIMRQQLTPDAFRGRVNGIHMILAFGGPQLGELESGLLAAFVGIPVTILTGGLATILLVGWVAWKYPDLRAYAPDPLSGSIVK